MTNRDIIRTSDELSTYLWRIIHQPVHEAPDVGRSEKNKQKTLKKDLKTLRSIDEPQEVDEADDEEEVSVTVKDETVPATAPQLKKPSPQKVVRAKVGDILKTLNLMRSGKSVKDPVVNKAIKTYISGLTTGEQQSLYTFLNGLAEMMVGIEPGKAAIDPGDVGIQTKAIPLKGAEEDDITVDVKASSGPSQSKGRPGDKEMPIVVGERANKARELLRMKHLRGR